MCRGALADVFFFASCNRHRCALPQVIFGSHGALAGVQGVAAVAVHIDGLPIEQGDSGGEMQLNGLPFQGSVRVGKKSTLLQP